MELALLSLLYLAIGAFVAFSFANRVVYGGWTHWPWTRCPNCMEPYDSYPHYVICKA